MQIRDAYCRYVPRIESAIVHSRVAKVLRKHDWIVVLLAVVVVGAVVWLARVFGIALGVTFGATLA